ncbi:MAG: fumarylacetoacetate hydrolase family protein, partial [Anaerolineaceae bacterium]|nr:fumarylacetoacetate hydrolase family protein [Anaerolineaceae bacterium]
SGEGSVHYGWIYNDLVGEIEGDIFGEFRRLEASLPLYTVKLLPPVVPGKIVACEWNYLDQTREYNRIISEMPSIFFKPTSSLIGMNDPIVLPLVSQQVEQECELALIIGRTTKSVLPEHAFDSIFGYTIANDVTARDLQMSDETWTRAKGFDSFCPLGPLIETDFEPADALLTCRVNGELRQMASTRDMLFPVQNLVAFISSIMTLYPGDVILTGTPVGSALLSPGDVVESQIDGIGQLINPVQAQAA